ncbi:N-acetyltransferase, partial [Staphylococcus succinus]
MIVDESIKLRDALDDDAKEYLKIPFNKELLEMYGSNMNPNTVKSLDKARLLVYGIKADPYECILYTSDAA